MIRTPPEASESWTSMYVKVGALVTLRFQAELGVEERREINCPADPFIVKVVTAVVEPAGNCKVLAVAVVAVKL